MTERVPDLLVEKLALGELPEDEAAAVRQTLEATGDNRLDEIQASNAEILRDYPPNAVADKIRRRLEREGADRPSTWGRWIWLPAAAVAAALILWFATRGDELAAPEPEDSSKELIAKGPQILLKGDAQLIIKRARGASLDLVQPDDAFSEHDLLQLSYRAGDRKHGVIVSIDGAGAATLHYPASESAPTDLEPGNARPLPDSFELDAAPRFERFFLVTADEPIDVTNVMGAARTLAGSPGADRKELDLPAAWRQQSSLLRKR